MKAPLRIGVPEVVKRLQLKSRQKLFKLAPWPEADLIRAYLNKKVDADYDVSANIRGRFGG